jgi:hypothetical protein
VCTCTYLAAKETNVGSSGATTKRGGLHLCSKYNIKVETVDETRQATGIACDNLLLNTLTESPLLVQVHIRLTDKGKVYAESIGQLREKVKKYDESGRRLFTPSINKESKSSGDQGSVSAQSQPPASFSQSGEFSPLPPEPPVPRGHPAPAAADEFLYQDARDREERYRLRERELQAEVAARAAASKMNASSMTLLRRRAVSV